VRSSVSECGRGDTRPKRRGVRKEGATYSDGEVESQAKGTKVGCGEGKTFGGDEMLDVGCIGRGQEVFLGKLRYIPRRITVEKRLTYRAHENRKSEWEKRDQHWYHLVREMVPYPIMNSKLPSLHTISTTLSSASHRESKDERTRRSRRTYVKATANFLGFNANKGIVKKATKKQINPPATHAMNPMNLRHPSPSRKRTRSI
jgi:hypothetical protein